MSVRPLSPQAPGSCWQAGRHDSRHHSAVSHCRCDSTEKLRALLPRLEQELKDTAKFKDFYQFTFTFAKNPGQKGLGECKIHTRKKPHLHETESGYDQPGVIPAATVFLLRVFSLRLHHAQASALGSELICRCSLSRHIDIQLTHGLERSTVSVHRAFVISQVCDRQTALLGPARGPESCPGLEIYNNSEAPGSHFSTSFRVVQFCCNVTCLLPHMVHLENS